MFEIFPPPTIDACTLKPSRHQFKCKYNKRGKNAKNFRLKNQDLENVDKMSEHKVYFAPMMANDLGLGFTDKRNRNPNWTDHEIIRFLEILQEEQVLKDLAANKNKQVSTVEYQIQTVIRGESCNPSYWEVDI
jgi:hypothetical protein